MKLDDYLQGFDEHEVDESYPNARNFYTGSLFVCHAGADFQTILELIAFPVLLDRFGDGYFLHNRRSGGSQAYMVLVRAALHWCDKFVLVVSQNAEDHKWVRSELDWLYRHAKPLIVCLLEDVRASRIHPKLAESLQRGQHGRHESVVDFRQNALDGQAHLGALLDKQLTLRPYPRFPGGPGFLRGRAKESPI
jgi:hypothetical protein